jgi:NADH-ubiquinone oxidoreductase chain 5
LGLVSFLLIVYYQNQSRITSGLFTLIINRLGDCFFLLLLAVAFLNLGSFSFVLSFCCRTLTSALLVFTFITKRAIYPFSPWLPLAMAAPTPISALVHSSTLVTAGLFLILRLSYFIFVSI